MILRHYLHTEPAVAISYIFGCGGHRAGAVVDPVAAADCYLRGSRGILVDLMLRDVPPAPPGAVAMRAENLGRPVAAQVTVGAR